MRFWQAHKVFTRNWHGEPKVEGMFTVIVLLVELLPGFPDVPVPVEETEELLVILFRTTTFYVSLNWKLGTPQRDCTL